MATKTIAIIGPESTGKSTLVAALAAHYQAPFSTEAARDFLLAKNRVEATLEDMLPIAKMQAESAQLLRQSKAPLLFLDTCLFTTCIWSQLLYGQVPSQVQSMSAAEQIDLILLCDIDLPFAPDPMRCFPLQAQREHLMNTMQRALVIAGKSFHHVRGQGHARTQNAIAILNRCL